MTTPALLFHRLCRRWIRFLGLGGLCVLVLSMIGAGWMLRGSGSFALGSESPSGAGSDKLGVFCQGYVDVEGGVVLPYPTMPGRVVEVRVHEGDTVHAGDVLFRLDPTLAQLQVDDAEAGVKIAESQLAKARKDPQRHKLQVAGQAKARDAMQFELESTRKIAARKRDLYDKAKYVALEEVDIANVLVKKCEAAVEAEQIKLEGVQLEVPEETIRQAEQNLKHAQALRDKARYALNECLVKAPTAGSVLRLALQAGELLGPDPKIPPLIFCPASPRIVRAEVEQEWASRVAVGQHATIQDDCTADGPVWTGKVQRLADWMAHRRSVLPDPSQFYDVRTLECIIRLDPGTAPVRIGQRVRITLE